MIDVSDYIKRLDELRMKIFCQIDGFIWIDWDTIPIMSFKKVFEIYDQTGIMFYDAYKNFEPTCYTPEMDSALTEAKKILNQ